jgi:uncharacterized membrane protein
MSASVEVNPGAGTQTENRSRPARTVRAKHIFFLVYAVMTLFVLYRYEAPFLDSQSPTWEHFAKVTWWLVPHGLAGALALFIGPLQFSNRLRRRQLQLHRYLGRLYVLSVFVASPISVLIAIKQGPPSILMAAVVQASAWMLTTAAALFCIRRGNIQQHRQWMIRSYPFAMVFVFTRVLLAIPAIEKMGELGLIWAVWGCVAAACFIPSFVINWRAMFSSGPRQTQHTST